MKAFLVLTVAVFLSFPAILAADNKDNKKESDAVATIEAVKTVQISGSVIDNESNEALAGATIYVNGQKYYSDLDGNFNLSNIQPGKHQIRVELISYEISETEVDIQDNQKLAIALSQK
ncbi:carboxypeptidase-like regulatory domain-containing protein [Limibacterium fermenti]|uniref:carboxypeptidase-like regulatory domain-containing protein n=1 Tax=Limibacterium fermenti TaxID=3229863 RepID=UPI000E92E64E|nr:hypothetical protein [Porphyromonadaceae bacterium]HBX45860.1 hypothetical protein [Porphyromonadaceae bacterium]